MSKLNKYDALHLSDIYSLMLFILYKVKDIPEYSVLSELCYLLDGSNIHRLLTYFAGKTVTFPSAEDLTILSNAMLLYQYINMDKDEYVAAVNKLPEDLTEAQKAKVTELYLQIIQIMNDYNIDRGKAKKNARY